MRLIIIIVLIEPKMYTEILDKENQAKIMGRAYFRFL